jgi:hypothetical protein
MGDLAEFVTLPRLLPFATWRKPRVLAFMVKAARNEDPAIWSLAPRDA